jgi:hypothetical protein
MRAHQLGLARHWVNLVKPRMSAPSAVPLSGDLIPLSASGHTVAQCRISPDNQCDTDVTIGQLEIYSEL